MTADLGPDLGAPLPVTITDIEAAAGAARRPSCAGPRSSRTGRWPSGSAVRCSSSARTSSAPARSRSAAPTPGSPGSPTSERARGVVAASAGNHAQGVALAGADARHPGQRSTCRRTRRCRRCRRPGRTAPRSSSSTADVDECLVHARAWAEQDRRGPHPPVRPRRHRRRARARSAWRSSSSARTSRTVLVCTGGGGLLAGIAAAVRAQRPDVARHRRPGRGGRRVPAVAVRRAAGAAGDDDHDGRRDRGRLPGRGAVRARPGPGRRRRHGQRGAASPARCCSCSSGPSSSSSPPARPAWPRCSTRDRRPAAAAGRRGALRRQHRPAADDAGHPARHGRGRPLPAGAAAGSRPPRQPGDAARRARRGRGERARGRARAHRRPALASTRSRSRCGSRPRGPTTAAPCSPRCAPRASRCRSEPAPARRRSVAGPSVADEFRGSGRLPRQ